MEPADVVAQVDASGLRGRGGAGFPPVARRRSSPRSAPGYLCVNADESEPGTFKDREIMLREPARLLIEGVPHHELRDRRQLGVHLHPRRVPYQFEVLAWALTTRAAGVRRVERRPSGYNVRSCSTAARVPTSAAKRRRCSRRLMACVASRARSRRSPPSAASTPSRRSSTTSRPSRLAVHPRDGRRRIRRDRRRGARACLGYGTRVFSLSGNVSRPGNYELPITSTLRTDRKNTGGGVPEGRKIKAIIPGRSSTPILTPKLDTDDRPTASSRGRPGRWSAPARSWSSTTARAWRSSPSGSPSSTSTRAAGSARRAARARAGRSTSSAGIEKGRRPRTVTSTSS